MYDNSDVFKTRHKYNQQNAEQKHWNKTKEKHYKWKNKSKKTVKSMLSTHFFFFVAFQVFVLSALIFLKAQASSWLKRHEYLKVFEQCLAYKPQFIGFAILFWLVENSLEGRFGFSKKLVKIWDCVQVWESTTHMNHNSK